MSFRYFINVFFAWLCGALFSIGLLISQMVDAEKVLSFLDIAGEWDPALLVVMTTALVVYWICFFAIKPGLQKPILARSFMLPENNAVDSKLVAGAGLFGVGWGVTGLCPGPAITNLTSGNTKILLYVATMLISMFVYDLLTRKITPT